MVRKILLFTMIVFAIHTIDARPNEIIIHSSGNPSHDQIYIEPPVVTYDDDLNELYVYFGTTGTIDLEYDDGTGAPYYYIYGESHVGYTSTTYYNLPAGYYTITIHSIYGYTYYGNFTVS